MAHNLSWFQPVQQSRKQVLRPYYPNIYYTVVKMIDKTPKFRVENNGNCYSLKRFSKELPALIPIEPRIGPKVCKIVNR